MANPDYIAGYPKHTKSDDKVFIGIIIFFLLLLLGIWFLNGTTSSTSELPSTEEYPREY